MRLIEWLQTAWFLLICMPLVHADNWAPSIDVSTFPTIVNILQFKDSSRQMLRTADQLFTSFDSGKTWELIDLPMNDENTKFIKLQEFEYHPNMALAFTNSKTHFYTVDQGESWQSFDLDRDGAVTAEAIVNYVQPDYVLLKLRYFEDNGEAKEYTYYSKDGLRSQPPRVDIDNIGDCTFTKTNPYFTNGDDATIVCIKREFNYLGILKGDSIISSNDFFENLNDSKSNELDNSHVLSIKIVKSFLVLVVTTDRYISGSTVLYTSKDGITFYKTSFEDSNKSWMYSILDSTPDALYVSVYGRNGHHAEAASDIYKSDSEGRFFKKIFGDVFSNMLGMSLISKVETLDGVWIASHNVEYHHMKLPSSKSMITYDDGKSWTYLNITDSDNCNNDDECSLHIAWLTERSGDGEIVTGQTPGILIGVGNVGKYLEHSFDKLKTFLSRDGGLTWKKISDKPSIFAFGDIGNIIVTAPVDLNYFLTGKTDTVSDYVSFSLDQGDTWSELKLGTKVVPLYFVNNDDSTDTSILMNSLDPNGESILHTFDFSTAFDKICTDEDKEEWLARVDPSTKEQVCVYGHSEKFIRRKSNAKCFMNQNFEDLKPIEIPCKCTPDDVECNFGFSPDDNNECQPIMEVLTKMCEDKKTITLSKQRITPGNICEGGYSPPKDDYKLLCKDAKDVAKKTKIQSRLNTFSEHITYYQYLEKDLSKLEYQDETLLILTASRKAYILFDSETFVLVAPKSFVYVFTNSFWPDSVYLITDEGEIFASSDRGRNFKTTMAPYTSKGYSNYEMEFDKTSPDTYILISGIDCDSYNHCQRYASLTTNNGDEFTDLVKNVNKCTFARSAFDPSEKSIDTSQVICSQLDDNQSTYKLISLHDRKDTETEVVFQNIVGYAVNSGFIVVATIKDGNSLEAFVSSDGIEFAVVKFPPFIDMSPKTAYTILDSHSKELLIHTTTFDETDKQFGAILKGNYNGTLFTTLFHYANRNNEGYVDFEQLQGAEGSYIVNIVSNAYEVMHEGVEKKIQTRISHNDGVSFTFLIPSVYDSDQRKYPSIPMLHLHSYTERLDPIRDTFSSATAVGLLFGLGNVGTELAKLNYNENDDVALFFSFNGGTSWNEVAKGHYIWEFGDQGTVLVIAQTLVKVNSIRYSLNMGSTWEEYKFAPDDRSYLVEDIATVPSDNSLKFILIVKDTDSSHSIFTIDFSNVYERQCQFPVSEDDSNSDFEFIRRESFTDQNCLFGHQTMFLRRHRDADCFIGLAPLSLGERIVKNCTCTREDFECDYNYELSDDGTCQLIKGLTPLRGDEVCKIDGTDAWYEPTGYRKNVMSTCEGGIQLDKWKAHACPGKTLEGVKVTGWSMFFIIFVPLVVFASSLVFVYERGIRRNGGFTRLGQIRLDEGDNLQLIEENRIDKVVNAVVKVGVVSFQIMGRGVRFISKFWGRLTSGNTNSNSGSIGAFFNDLVDDDQSLFGDMADDEDAREIDSFLDNDDNFNESFSHEDEFAEPVESTEDIQNPEFHLSDEED
ncbi:hypothetical protein CANINC_003614 [Pichia inconspicua]|uniref:VPS10 domain-containing protein n=1 Tax=Pichia inconspicua TaxID=52247 RepID=A0A4T0WY75_9ASCO|nr:hypothetical protein CANINC_003614 [[Candida] inconspicua]